MSIWRQGHQSPVFQRSSDRKVIERLKAQPLHGHDLMNGVVEKTSDAGGPDPCRFRFQIKHLSHEA